MKQKLFFLLLLLTLLASCTTGQVPSKPIAADGTSAAPAQPTEAPAIETTDLPAATSTAALGPIPTPERKEPLPQDAWMNIPVVPTSLSDRARQIYEYGLSLGNDPTHFSIIGDCQNVSSYFLSVFDKQGEYSLGTQYAYLQPTIDYYQGSYSRKSLESPLDCELRKWRPSIVIVSMETWWSEKPATEYDKYMRKVLDRIIETGALPIIATKADNLEGDNSINATVAQIAYEYQIPMWNFWAAVHPLQNHGLSPDGFHLTFARNFFDDPQRMKSAWPWRNLTALQTLDFVHNALSERP
jgi:hypothetical protein